MTSPCGKIRIPINESQDDKSQIEEYLREYHGEGIQHIALATDDIYATVDALRRNGVEFQDTPDTYYEGVDARVPGHGEPLAELQRRRILIDGAPTGRRPAADLHQERDRPDLLRDHPAQGQRGLRRGQFPRAVRVDRTRPGAARRDLTIARVASDWTDRRVGGGGDGGEAIHSGVAGRGHGLAPGALRPARRHLRARDEQGGLLRPGRALPSPPPADRLDRVQRAAAAARLRPHQAARPAPTSPWSAHEVLANAHCRIRFWRLAAACRARAQRRRRRAAVRPRGPRRPVLRLRPPRDRGGRLPRAAARHDVAPRAGDAASTR